MNPFLCFAAAAVMAIAGAAKGAPATAAIDTGPQLITLSDGRHINIVCAGHGFPTVIFEQGSGESILDWSKVQKPVSDLTRACFYDRAGLGYSDQDKRAATATRATDDLHALLRAANIERPVVLVGHSLGGLFATLYADRFPEDVAGLVLVDTSFATQFGYPISGPGKEIVETDQREYLNSLKKCFSFAKDRELSADNPHGCFAPPNLAISASRYLIHQYTRPGFYAVRISESENFLPVHDWKSVDGVEENALRRNFGNMPIEVLTAALTPHNPRKTAADNASFADWWRKGHRELAARSTRGETTIVARSGHNIQNDQPNAVIEAIKKVLELLRRN